MTRGHDEATDRSTAQTGFFPEEKGCTKDHPRSVQKVGKRPKCWYATSTRTCHGVQSR